MNRPSTSEQPAKRNLRKRTVEDYRVPAEWEVSGLTDPGSDFSPAGSEDEYQLPGSVIPSKKNRSQSARGFFRYREVTRQRGALHFAGGSNDLIGISSRGQVSGRRRRGRPFGSSTSRRSDMLQEHRRIVQDLNENDSIDVSADDARNISQLNEGTYVSNSCKQHFFSTSSWYYYS